MSFEFNLNAIVLLQQCLPFTVLKLFIRAGLDNSIFI